VTSFSEYAICWLDCQASSDVFLTLQLKLITKTWHYFDNSQPPVIRRACFAVGLFNIYFSYTGVVLDHIQRAVTQQRLQSEHIPPERRYVIANVWRKR
jgi:hypothetical protein